MEPLALLPFLSAPLRAEIAAQLSIAAREGQSLAEVRLRTERRVALTLYRRGTLTSRLIGHVCTEEEMRRTLAAVCDGSVYAHEESMCAGYISIAHGVRVGIGGRAVVREGRVFSLAAVTSLVFRIPAPAVGAAAPLCAFFRESEGGILLFAPPGGGKTTALRDLVRTVGRERRIAVIDTRGEFFAPEPDSLADILTGYPKSVGAEIAVRSLSPELLVLDEIGAAETATLATLSSLGVRTVATVHGRDAAEVLRSDAVRRLFELGLFSYLWDVRAQKPICATGGRSA